MMTDQEARRAGRWIADARKLLHDWRQEDLATASGLSKSNLSNIETGKQGPEGWRRSTIASIEDALQVDRGTILRVAKGEDINPRTIEKTPELGQILEQISRLAATVSRLDERVRALGG